MVKGSTNTGKGVRTSRENGEVHIGKNHKTLINSDDIAVFRSNQEDIIKQT